MTDIARTQNIYYESRLYNGTNQPIQATVDANLIYPLIQNSSDYQVGLAKATIPLNTIPLTQSNIPLKTYALGVQQGQYIGTAFVRQVNASTSNFLYSLDGLSIGIYTYSSSSIKQTGTIDLSPFMNYVYNFFLDDYLNVYVAGSSSNQVFADTFYIISPTSQLISSSAYTRIKSIFINDVQQVFLVDETQAGTLAYVYDNVNSVGSVALTQIAEITKDYAGNTLNNVRFIVSTLTTIIIGHDGNILSYYNLQTAQPYTDYTNPAVNNMTCANVLNADNTLIVADLSLDDDGLYGTNSAGEIVQALGNTILTNGIAFSAMAITDNGYGFIADSNGYVDYVITPVSNPPQSFTQLTTSPLMTSLASNKAGLYGIESNNILTTIGLYAGNTWSNTFVNFKINNDPILSFDYNNSADTILAVGTDNNLYLSNTPVEPFNYMYVNNGIVETRGASNNTLAAIKPTIQVNSVSIPDVVCVSLNALNSLVYCVEGKAGSQVVVVRNYTNFGLTPTGATITLAECAGTILQLITYNNYIIVLDGTYVVRTYTFVGAVATQQYASAPYLSTDNIYLAPLDYNTNYLISGVNSFGIVDASNNANVILYNFPAGTSGINVCCNINDITNGCYTVFCGVNQTGGLQSVIKYTFTTGYASVDTITTIYSIQPPYGGVYGVWCNPNYGWLCILSPQESSPNSIIVVLEQSQNYNSGGGFTIRTEGDYATGQFYLLNQTINPIGWTQQTSNIPLASVAVSRTNANTIYAIHNTNKTIYQGTLNAGAITFIQVAALASQTYNYISTAPNNSPTYNTTLRTYTISSQQPLSTYIITDAQIKTIAKDESTASYIVPYQNGNLFYSFNSSLALNYSQILNGVYNIFAKAGDDIYAGAVSIYSFSILIAKINEAFTNAFNQMKKGNPSPLGSAPTISLNYSSGIATLNYATGYTTAGNAIYFNNALLQLISFYPNLPYSGALSQLNGFNQIILDVGSTSKDQTASSIWQFNQLDKIALQSNTIFVADSYFGNNQTNRIIATIDVPTSSLIENNGVLYFQPNFMRPYVLASTNSINRIQIDVLYSYKDFTTYPLLLAPNSNYTALLDFIKKY